MAERSGQHLTDALIATLGAMLSPTTPAMVVWAAVAVASLAAYVVCELRSAGRL